MSEPRETARQIAELLRENIERSFETYQQHPTGMYSYVLSHPQAKVVASLTADLAQARKEWTRANLEAGMEQLQQQLAAAEQARDEALAVLQSPDKWMKWCDSRVLERAEAVEALSLKLVDGMNAQAVAALASEAERNVELECQLAVEKTARAAAEQARDEALKETRQPFDLWPAWMVERVKGGRCYIPERDGRRCVDHPQGDHELVCLTCMEESLRDGASQEQKKDVPDGV